MDQPFSSREIAEQHSHGQYANNDVRSSLDYGQASVCDDTPSTRSSGSIDLHSGLKEGSDSDEGSDDTNKLSTGKWSRSEHQRFIEAFSKHGHQWRRVTECVRTRTLIQVRSHAQKFLNKYNKRCRQLQSCFRQDTVMEGPEAALRALPYQTSSSGSCESEWLSRRGEDDGAAARAEPAKSDVIVILVPVDIRTNLRLAPERRNHLAATQTIALSAAATVKDEDDKEKIPLTDVVEESFQQPVASLDEVVAKLQDFSMLHNYIVRAVCSLEAFPHVLSRVGRSEMYPHSHSVDPRCPSSLTKPGAPTVPSPTRRASAPMESTGGLSKMSSDDDPPPRRYETRRRRATAPAAASSLAASADTRREAEMPPTTYLPGYSPAVYQGMMSFTHPPFPMSPPQPGGRPPVPSSLIPPPTSHGGTATHGAPPCIQQQCEDQHCPRPPLQCGGIRQQCEEPRCSQQQCAEQNSLETLRMQQEMRPQEIIQREVIQEETMRHETKMQAVESEVIPLEAMSQHLLPQDDVPQEVKMEIVKEEALPQETIISETVSPESMQQDMPQSLQQEGKQEDTCIQAKTVKQQASKHEDGAKTTQQSSAPNVFNFLLR